MGGLREILGCMQSNVPLHGHTNSQDPGGIAECRTLWLELYKNKHAAAKTQNQANVQNDEDSRKEMKDVDMMTGMDDVGGAVIVNDEGEELVKKPMDPLEQEARMDAQKHGSHIHRFNGRDGLKMLEQKLCLVLVLVDVFRTSFSRLTFKGKQRRRQL